MAFNNVFHKKVVDHKTAPLPQPTYPKQCHVYSPAKFQNLLTKLLYEYTHLIYFVLMLLFQIRGIHTLIRDRDISKHDFVFYSDRLIRLVIFTIYLEKSPKLIWFNVQQHSNDNFQHLDDSSGCRAWPWTFTFHWETSYNSYGYLCRMRNIVSHHVLLHLCICELLL